MKVSTVLLSMCFSSGIVGLTSIFLDLSIVFWLSVGIAVINTVAMFKIEGTWLDDAIINIK